MLRKPEISAGLMGLLARMQTLPLPLPPGTWEEEQKALGELGARVTRDGKNAKKLRLSLSFLSELTVDESGRVLLSANVTAACLSTCSLRDKLYKEPSELYNTRGNPDSQLALALGPLASKCYIFKMS